MKKFQNFEKNRFCWLKMLVRFFQISPESTGRISALGCTRKHCGLRVNGLESGPQGREFLGDEIFLRLDSQRPNARGSLNFICHEFDQVFPVIIFPF